ncbi:MAG: hypothetical protein OES57_00460 [Acidimicrobiia bacterium]|nr:hypothetical protein [Acidimicrobiia bacterium]
MQRTDSTAITVTDLAVEFGLSIDDMLGLCEMFDIDAPSADAVLTPRGVVVLRGVANGEIDPDSIVIPTADPVDPGPPPPGSDPTRQRRLPRLGDRARRDDDAERSPDRRRAGEDLPEVPTTSFWARHIRTGGFDGYVPRWLRAVYIVSTLAVIAVVWWLAVGFGSDDQSPDSLFDAAPGLTLGSCFNADSGLWLDSATVVACGGPHDAQAIAVLELTPAGRSYPDLDDLRSEALVRCVDHLRSEVTLADGERVAASVPAVSVWQSGDQRVLCSIVDGGGGKLVGSSP